MPAIHFRVDGEEIRAVLLEKTRQWLYYAVQADPEQIWVYTIWGTRRDEPPL